jgi:hypothetical protein
VAYFDEIETRLKQIFEYDEEIKDLHNKLENHLRGKERKEYDFLTCLWKLTLDDEAFYNSGLLDELKVNPLLKKRSTLLMKCLMKYISILHQTATPCKTC